MFRNYLKIALRNIKRHPGYSFINVMGLAIGMACTILILLWVQFELSYDKYHNQAQQIYRVSHQTVLPNYQAHFARCPYGWVNALPDEFPEILDLVRFQHEYQIAIQYDDNIFNEKRFFRADANVFDIFSFRLLWGNPKTALKEPNSVVVSATTARKYFGNQDPVGKILTTRSQRDSVKVYTVTGVFEDIPQNSHFQADFLAAIETPREALRNEWSYVYLLFKEGSRPIDLEKQFPKFIEKYTNQETAANNSLHLQPLVDIHLHSNLDREIEPNGNMVYVIIFSLTAFFILLIACINFINLSTARATQRAREIGVRKIVGADRAQLIKYFLGESILFCSMALILAMLIIKISLPLFYDLLGKTISVNYLVNWRYLLALLFFPFLIGIIAGSYPALFLSSLKPISAIKGKGEWRLSSGVSNFQNKISIRNALVVIQFSLSIAFIICCAITYSQHNYLIQKRLGSQQEQIVAIPNTPDSVRGKFQILRNELSGQPGIIDISAAMEEPSKQILDAMPFAAEGLSPVQENTTIYVLSVYNNFIDFFSLELVAGTNFPPYSGEHSEETYVLNETAVRMIGWNSPEDALGKRLHLTPAYIKLNEGTIVGVVKDFNFSSLRKKIKPLVLFQKPIWYFCFLIKVQPKNINSTVTTIENKWGEIYPDYPFEYIFVDDLFARLYQTEQKQATILGLFSALGISIACLGLFALATFSVANRTKEIGVRKVLGASIPGIVILFSKEFTKWILVANIVAWPVVYLAMKSWLQNYAYHININLWIFVLAGALALILALLTISYQAVKAAAANPVDSLRYE